MIRTAVVGGVLGVLAGCVSEDTSLRTIQTDSAGVAIVESVAPQWAEAEGWALDSIPFFTLSGSGPEYDFADVADATLLSDARLVVLDGGAHQVRFFGSDGAFAGAMGQEGEGPGDFSRLTSVSELPGDSVLVFDYWLRRGTILDRTGSVARIMTLPTELQVQELFPVTAGSFVAKMWSLDDFVDVEGDYRSEYLIAQISADGTWLGRITSIPGWSGYKVNTGDGGYRDYAPLLIIDGHLAANASGIVVGAAERMEFLRYSVEGNLELVVRVPVLDEPFETVELSDERDAMIRPGSSSEYRKLVRQLPAPELRPPYSDLLIDSEGFVWVARYWSPRTHPDDPVLWHVFSSDGAWLGNVMTPSRFTVFEVGSDYVLGARRDEYDVQEIEMLRLKR